MGIVTNHGSALRSNPEPRGITLNLAPQTKTETTGWINSVNDAEDTSDLREKRKADHGTDSGKKHGKPIRGRRARKGRKRNSSTSTKLNSNAQAFKPAFHQRTSSNKFEPLKVVTSNQIVQVSQEKDRKYHF